MSMQKLEEMYYKYHLMVKDVAFHVLQDYHLAQDVCHDVFLKITDEWIELNRPHKLTEQYLRVMAYHKAIDYYRLKKRKPEKTHVNSMLEEEVLICEEIEKRVDYTRFTADFFHKLKEYRENWYTVLLHMEVYHEPAELVAREMGISLPLLRTWLHRAKQWICDTYGEEYEDLL